MITRLRKWGNSLAVRIPKSFAVEALLAEETPVELWLGEGKRIVQPLRPRQVTLGELLRGVADENLHGRLGWSGVVGTPSPRVSGGLPALLSRSLLAPSLSGPA